MKCGIISDIHSNLEALTVCLDVLSDAHEVVCVGDVIGYGPSPNECCDVLRRNGITTILGNHDAVVSGRMPMDWFNPVAKEAAVWTQQLLTSENREWLEGLPMGYQSADFVMVHGSLVEPELFHYITNPRDAESSFALMGDQSLCFIGHTHVAEYYVRKVDEPGVDLISMPSGGEIQLRAGFQYIVNCGSVGQARDRIPMASLGIYDSDTQIVEIHRLQYPIYETQDKMRSAGLPEPLITRLDFGV